MSGTKDTMIRLRAMRDLSRLRGRVAAAWDESKHPRDKGKFASSPGAPGGGGTSDRVAPAESKPKARPPHTMTPAAVNKELDALEAERTRINDELIKAGRGHERPSERRGKSDPLSVHDAAVERRYQDLLKEIAARTGSNYRRMPHGAARRREGEGRSAMHRLRALATARAPEGARP